MAQHVLLLTWPAPAGERPANSPDAQLSRFKKIDELVGLAGLKKTSLTWTMGRVDAVLTVEGDAERVAVLARALGSVGGIHTETLAGFDEAEGNDIAAAAARIIGGNGLHEGRIIGGEALGPG